MDIPFTEEESIEILVLINIAVKQCGLEGSVARNAIYFQDKLNKAFTPVNKK